MRFDRRRLIVDGKLRSFGWGVWVSLSMGRFSVGGWWGDLFRVDGKPYMRIDVIERRVEMRSIPSHQAPAFN